MCRLLITDEVAQKVIPFIKDKKMDPKLWVELKTLEIFKRYEVEQGDLTDIYFRKGKLIINTESSLLITDLDFLRAKVYRNHNLKLLP